MTYENADGYFYGDHDEIIANLDWDALARADFEKGVLTNTQNKTYLNTYGNLYANAESQAHYSRGL